MDKNNREIGNSLRVGKMGNRFLRLFTRDSNSQAFLINSDRKHVQRYTLNSETLVVTNQHMREVEVTKAIVIAQSRHHDWKAGGAM